MVFDDSGHPIDPHFLMPDGKIHTKESLEAVRDDLGLEGVKNAGLIPAEVVSRLKLAYALLQIARVEITQNFGLNEAQKILGDVIKKNARDPKEKPGEK